VDVVDLIERLDQRVRYHYTLIDVLAAWSEGEVMAGADAAEVLWAEWAEVEKKVAWSETVRIIDRAYRMYARLQANPST
jgi:ADP-ribose pyrophosphatase YjhB (NUDIX family)